MAQQTFDFTDPDGQTVRIEETVTLEAGNIIRFSFFAANVNYNPETGNGFSGLNIGNPFGAIPLAQTNPPGWLQNTFAGGVDFNIEWDKPAGDGIMPGQSGLFEFTLPAERWQAGSTGADNWIHSWRTTAVGDRTQYDTVYGPMLGPVPKPVTLPPTAIAQTSTPLLGAGGTAVLDGRGSHDNDTIGPPPEIQQYDWTLVNLTVPDQEPIPVSSTESVARKVLTAPGEYEATLVVTDNDGEKSIAGASDAHVTIQVVQVTFDKNPVIVGISKTETVTATVVPANAVGEVAFSVNDVTIATVDKNSIAASPGTLTLTGLARGTTTLRAEITTDLGSATCGSTIVQGGKVDFVRITPDPGILTPGARTTFTAVGFGQVQGFHPLPHSFSPDLATAPGAEVTSGGGKGIFLGPVPQSWRLSGGPAAQAFIPADVPKQGVSSVQVEATADAAGDIKPDLFAGDEDGAGLKVIKVVFDKTEVRPGKTVHPATVTVTVTPNDVAVQFDTDKPATATITEGQKNILTVNGVDLSAANQDTKLQAKSGGKVIATLPITVVEPRFFDEISPVVDNTPEADHKESLVFWIAPVPIIILDQFHFRLGPNWAGSLVKEELNGNGVISGFTNPKGDPLNDKGIVIDPVEVQATDLDNKTIANVMNGKQTLTIPKSKAEQTLYVDDKKLQGLNSRTSEVVKNVLTVTNSVK